MSDTLQNRVEHAMKYHFHKMLSAPCRLGILAALVPGGTLGGRNDRTAETGELRLPYGFPSPGLYRVWLQLTVDDVVRTGVFDMLAN